MAPIDPKILEPELARWRAEGWVAQDGAARILADARAAENARRRDAPASGLLTIFGALLFCLAAAAFVAANWAAIPRPGKLLLLIALIWTAYGGAALARWRGANAVGHGLALVGAGLFGSSLMLVSQMYHMSGDAAGLFLVWGLGALLTGALLASPPSLALAGLLFVAWDATGAWLWDPSGFEKPFWTHLPFLPIWTLLSAALWRTGWRFGLHVAAIGLLYWLLQLPIRAADWGGPDTLAAWVPTFLIGLALFAAGVVGDRRAPWKGRFEALRPGLGRTIAIYGQLVAMPALFAMTATSEGFGFGEGAVLLMAGAGALWIGAAGRHVTLVAWSAAWIALALVVIYVATVGTMLETALFFLLAAVVVGGVAWVARRLDQRPPPDPAPDQGPGTKPSPEETPNTPDVAMGAGS
ncbi:MAG: DUF2157 domain-containing protein [Pseudomonadota bacterium]